MSSTHLYGESDLKNDVNFSMPFEVGGAETSEYADEEYREVLPCGWEQRVEAGTMTITADDGRSDDEEEDVEFDDYDDEVDDDDDFDDDFDEDDDDMDDDFDDPDYEEDEQDY